MLISKLISYLTPRQPPFLTATVMNRMDAWMIQRHAAELGSKVKIGCHIFRATGITAYLFTGDEITLDEVERIII
jgi:hypothetical protein